MSILRCFCCTKSSIRFMIISLTVFTHWFHPNKTQFVISSTGHNMSDHGLYDPICHAVNPQLLSPCGRFTIIENYMSEVRSQSDGSDLFTTRGNWCGISLHQ
jgi:hypothetical protein